MSFLRRFLKERKSFLTHSFELIYIGVNVYNCINMKNQ
jgi:hypothetical protein